MVRRILRKRWLLVLVLLSAAVLAVLIGMPYAIRDYAVQWLEANGGDRVQFDDVDFNPFSGTLLLKGLRVAVDDRTTLSFDAAGADLSWLALLHKQIEVRGVTLQGCSIVIDQRQSDRILVGGIRLPLGKSSTEKDTGEASRWRAGITSVTFRDIHVHYLGNDLDLQLDLDNLTLGRLEQWSAQTPTTLEAGGTLNKAAFSLSGELAPLAASPRYALKLSLTSLPLAPFAPLLKDRVPRLSGALSYDGTLDYSGNGNGFSVQQEGSTRVQNLDMALSQPPINITDKDASVRSKLSFSRSGSDNKLQLTSDVGLTGFGVVAPDSRLSLLHGGRAELSGLSLAGTDRLSIKSVAIEKLMLGRSADNASQDASMEVDKLQLSALSLADSLLSVDEVHYTGIRNHLRRDAKGNWRIIALLNAMRRLAGEEDTGEAPAAKAGANTGQGDKSSPALSAVVKRIRVDGKSAISLLDQSVKPPFETTVRIDSALLESLDTRKPNGQSPVKLKAGIGKHTTLSLQGDIEPFAKPLGMHLKADINALDLPPLSAYTRRALGLVLDSGSLSADATLDMDKQRMKGLVKLDLRQLALTNIGGAGSLQSRLPVPIDVALDTLRDSNNTISLKIPIEGNPQNPEFDINDVIARALATGVQKGALTYLALALQPYGTLIAAARYAGEEIARVRLNPIEFKPGQAILNDTDKDYLAKVARVMKDRPKLAIKVCGVAVQQDVAWLQKQAAAGKAGDRSKPADGDKKAAPATISESRLLQLAGERAAAVKDYLTGTFHTPADHLVGCRPRLETQGKEDAIPRADLLI